MVIGEVTIERLRALLLDGLDPLIAESEEPARDGERTGSIARARRSSPPG
jgi:hypothetical protein